MPSDSSDPRRSRSRSSGDSSRSSSSRESGSRSSKSSKPNGVKDAAKKAGQVASDAKDTAQKAAKVVGDTVGSAVDALGGWSQLDRYIKQYNPTFYEFAKDSFLKRFGATSKPSKFMLLLVALGVIQSTLPLFAWPLDYFARLLSFVFLFNTGLELLRKGWGSGSETDAMKVKSFLTTYLLVAGLELIPLFLFDTTYHFGALWTFLLPMAMFITPDKGNSKETLAIWIADSVFAQVSNVLDAVVPDSFVGSDQTTAFLSAGVLALLLWAGLLGGTGSYIMVFVVLTFATTHHIGKEYVSPKVSSSGFSAQMTIWHNLLAIWMWRYLVSVVEGIQVPGLISVVGWIQYHLPSYFLWMTALFFGMLLTKKTASSSRRANTWYANLFTQKSKSSSRSSESSSGQRSSGSSSKQPGSSSRDGKSSRSGSGEHRSRPK